MKFIGLLVFLFTVASQAGDFKFRAREHYDIHKIERFGVNESYSGFSNTFNAWFETPFRISYGLAFGPLLGSATKDNSALAAPLGNQVRLLHGGGEIKYFPMDLGLFTRGGLGWAQLRSDGPVKESNGYYFYAGLGWEVRFRKVGLAFEVAQRWVELQNDISMESFTPSIGLHFYDMF